MIAKTVKFIKLILASLVLTIIVCNLGIWLNSNSRTKNNISEVKKTKYALLLGMSPGKKESTIAFNNRCLAAKELYFNQKVDSIITSGSNRGWFNEAKGMKKQLIELGVNEKAIIVDSTGFRTYESIKNMKNRFKINDFVIVSQKYHNTRAIFLADWFDMEAQAYNAKNNGRTYLSYGRELLAKVKAVLDIFVKKIKN